MLSYSYQERSKSVCTHGMSERIILKLYPRATSTLPFHLSNLDHLDILKNIIPISYSEDIILIKPDGQEGTKHSKDLAITKEVNTDASGASNIS
jgi:hypothetical protein